MRSLSILHYSNYVIWDKSWFISSFNTLTEYLKQICDTLCTKRMDSNKDNKKLCGLSHSWTRVGRTMLVVATHFRSKVLFIWFITLSQNWSKQYTETEQHLTIPCFFSIFSVLTVLHRQCYRLVSCTFWCWV
jgi:hypothetical protein